MSTDYTSLPANLPAPVDDGAADHLPGSEVPAVALPSTLGGESTSPGLLGSGSSPTSTRGPACPGQPLPDGWDDIPGARGCTPQSCAFRDASTNSRRSARRSSGSARRRRRSRPSSPSASTSPIPLLSDQDLALADAMGLPTFETSGLRLYKRLTFIAERQDRQGLLSRLPARPQRCRRPRLAGAFAKRLTTVRRWAHARIPHRSVLHARRRQGPSQRRRQQPPGRRGPALESAGGSLERFYFAFGDTDAYVIVDLPDAEAAPVVALTVNSAGGATTKTVLLLTPEEVDAAAKRSVEYGPPAASAPPHRKGVH